MSPLKVNVVLVRGLNDDEILDFAGFARDTGRVVRFIEFMPLDAEGTWNRDAVVPSDEVLAAIDAVFPLVAIDPERLDRAPADRFAFADGGRGEVAVVASVTRPFCGTCNRLRLTADGAIRNCLFSDDEVGLREALREAAPMTTRSPSRCGARCGASSPATASTTRAFSALSARCR